MKFDLIKSTFEFQVISLPSQVRNTNRSDSQTNALNALRSGWRRRCLV